jgi:ABC-type antimicrobial peptide transport system permease subunit
MTIRIGTEIGATLGVITTIVVDWEHVLSRGIETLILSLLGGIAGAIGGLLVTWFYKRYIK